MRSKSSVQLLSSSPASAASKDVASQPNKSPIQVRLISGISLIFEMTDRDRGEAFGGCDQADVIDRYGSRVVEELEYENVRTQGKVKTVSDVIPGFVALLMSCDWHTNLRRNNVSTVEFCGDGLYQMSMRFCEALADWGRVCAYGHQVSKPIAVAGDHAFIRIKPFALNGPRSEDYVKRLDQLGVDLGRAVGGYLASRGEGLRTR